MKLKPSNGLFPLVAIGIFLSVPTFGQTAKMEFVTEETLKEAKSYTTPDPGDTENKTILKSTSSVAVRDSASQAPKVIKSVTVPSKITEKPSKPDEDPLSFNFLYYIIEKFKMSDMTE